jgi:hypothetical protein
MMKLGQRDMKRPILYYSRYEMLMTGCDEKSKCGYSTQFGSQWRKQMNSSEVVTTSATEKRGQRTPKGSAGL